MKVWAVYKGKAKRPIALFATVFEAQHFVENAPPEWPALTTLVEDWKRTWRQ